MDDELLEDFLIEAGEILERLNEELVELENSPEDMELLNSIFRGFHTIKGGAGFLAIDPMVAVCHRAEDVFNMVRNGERAINTRLMDTILPVLDVLNDQFDALRAGNETEAVAPELLSALDGIIKGEAVAEPAAEKPAVEEASEPTSNAQSDEVVVGGGEDITDDEFNVLLDALDGKEATAAETENTADEDDDDLFGMDDDTSSADSDEISEDEFEALLDQIHGEGSININTSGSEKPETTVDVVKEDKTAAASGDSVVSNSMKPTNDEISDDEFESLLDDLHGAGKIDTTKTTENTSAEKPAAAPKSAAPAKKEVAKETPKEKDTPKPAAKPKAAEKSKAADKPKPAAAKDTKQPVETSVRVDTARLDEIMNMVGELVLVRNRLTRLGSMIGGEEMSKAVANLDLVTADLQLSVMKTRMQPIKKVFGRFPRVVRDLARSLKKEIRLEMMGEDTDLDKNLVEALADPLVHLVRNSVDHGIEMPDDRVAAGKERQGSVILSASQEGDHILLSIEDDGKGMDADVLRNIAVERGMFDKDAAARIDDHEAYNLIFEPGFSTKKEISDISGRGVGMDVVKTSITQLNGSVEVHSQWGKGSRIEIKVPLTLAIMSTLMVRLGDQMFALPLVNVNEIFHLDLEKTNIMDGQLVTIVRERTLPLFYLKRWLVKGEMGADLPKDGHVVVVSIGTQKVCFLVDELIGQEEVVIKPLGALLQGLSGLAGATITGDGGIAIILDVPGLMKRYV
ncbi:Signal transduction histidine kinase CheA [hydrothermal vent metagenome]|uniref:histidine kinase n=1 Tax=hydrothermal vent metagenome TaxID=652676 RepID=A0A3B0ZJ57_9ZZZZ